MLKVLQRNELFNDTLEIIVCPYKQLPPNIKKLFGDNCDGCCAKMRHEGEIRWLVWLAHWEATNVSLALLVHELTHYVLVAIPEHGMSLTPRCEDGSCNTELAAYMLQMLTREVSDKLEVERAKIEKKRAKDSKRRSKSRRKDS